MSTIPIVELRKIGLAAGRTARVYAADLSAGFVRQIDSKGVKVVAGGAGLALVLGLGVGLVGRAPIDRALAPHPMVPVPGTSQIVAVSPPLTTSPSPRAAAPVTVAMADDAPTVATGDDPPAEAEEAPPAAAQDASADEVQGDAQAADDTAADPPPEIRMRNPRPQRREYYRYGPGRPDYPPPWAYQGPPRWAPPPPPPDYDPD